MKKATAKETAEQLVKAMERFISSAEKAIVEGFRPLVESLNRAAKILEPYFKELAEREGWCDADQFGDRS